MDYKKLTEKKKKLDKHRPFNSVLVKNLEEWFRIELTYTSNASRETPYHVPKLLWLLKRV